MRILTDLFDAPNRASTLLVLLPPAESKIEDFYTQGFIAAVRSRNWAIDIALAEVNYQHVMSKTSAGSLHEHIVLPAKSAGYERIWFAGISLGAFNALHYAAEYSGHLAGIHLIAPYPGTGDVLAEIIAAGGPGAWSRSSATNREDERAWWHWICRDSAIGQWPVPVYLSLGNEDRFLRGQHLLAGLLPADRVSFLPGAHVWPTWQMLWQDWLDKGPLNELAIPVTESA